MTGFASINQANFIGSWSITIGDVFSNIVYYIFHAVHWSSGLHQKYGIGFTLVRYPMSLLSLPSMFSVVCVI